VNSVTPTPLVLASGSERRRQLLRQIGVDPICVPANIDEAALPEESVDQLVLRLALGKAKAIAEGGDYDNPILGADTVVFIDGRTLGKPRNKVEAIEMLMSLQGREHQVMTGVCLLSHKLFSETGEQLKRQEAVALVESVVRFAPFGKEEAENYWNTGEPMGKAGAYALQGQAARFVAHLSGSYSNVVGLPLFETARLLDGLYST